MHKWNRYQPGYHGCDCAECQANNTRHELEHQQCREEHGQRFDAWLGSHGFTEADCPKRGMNYLPMPMHPVPAGLTELRDWYQLRKVDINQAWVQRRAELDAIGMAQAGITDPERGNPHGKRSRARR